MGDTQAANKIRGVANFTLTIDPNALHDFAEMNILTEDWYLDLGTVTLILGILSFWSYTAYPDNFLRRCLDSFFLKLKNCFSVCSCSNNREFQLEEAPNLRPEQMGFIQKIFNCFFPLVRCFGCFTKRAVYIITLSCWLDSALHCFDVYTDIDYFVSVPIYTPTIRVWLLATILLPFITSFQNS